MTAVAIVLVLAMLAASEFYIGRLYERDQHPPKIVTPEQFTFTKPVRPRRRTHERREP